MLRRAFSYALSGKIQYPAQSEVQGFVKPLAKYSPAQTVEFDSIGETLIYTAEAFNSASVVFPMPWSLGTYVGAPLCMWGWWTAALGPYSLLLAVPAYISLMPHLMHLQSLRKHIHKAWYIRGGLIKFETKDITGISCYTYLNPGSVKVADSKGNIHSGDYNSTILDASGKLTKKLKLQVSDWGNFDQGEVNAILTLTNKGKVHNPELFQAIFQGYQLDIQNFEMNFDPENSMVSSKSRPY